MALRNIPYAAQTSPTMIELDQTFADLSNCVVVPCTATGTNAITITPFANTPSIAAYANFLRFSFTAQNTSTGPVTVQVPGLAAINLYKAGTLNSQCSQSDVQINQFYDVVYSSVLNSSAGGAVIVSSNAPPAITSTSSSPGKVLQFSCTIASSVATGTTAMLFNNNQPTNTQGDQYIAAPAFTPTASSSMLVLDVTWFGSCSSAVNFTVATYVSGTVNAIGATAFDANAVATMPFTLNYRSLIRPVGTTSPLNFAVRAGGTAGTTTFNGQSGAASFSGAGSSSLTIWEMAGP